MSLPRLKSHPHSLCQVHGPNISESVAKTCKAWELPHKQEVPGFTGLPALCLPELPCLVSSLGEAGVGTAPLPTLSCLQAQVEVGTVIVLVLQSKCT